MIRDITIGQYYPGYSVIHKLDPRLKIMCTLLYITTLFLIKTFYGYILIFAAVAGIVAASKTPVRFLLRGLKPIIIIIVITFLLNMLMTKGTPLISWYFINITYEGLYTAVFMALRLVFLIIGSSLLTLTTKPMKLTDGIENLLFPFKKLGVPTHELAMMMTIALRFIPTLLEETDKIMKAQQARGADFESGSLFRRAKSLIPLFIPLFVGAFRIAQDLALAMEARCYHGGEGRTKLSPLRFKKRDAAATITALAFLAAIICERIFL